MCVRWEVGPTLRPHELRREGCGAACSSTRFSVGGPMSVAFATAAAFQQRALMAPRTWPALCSQHRGNPLLLFFFFSLSLYLYLSLFLSLFSFSFLQPLRAGALHYSLFSFRCSSLATESSVGLDRFWGAAPPGGSAVNSLLNSARADIAYYAKLPKNSFTNANLRWNSILR